MVGDLDGGFFEQWTCLLYRDMAYTLSHGHALTLDDVERVISRKIRDDYNALGGLDPGAMHVNWEREIQDYPSMGLRDEVQASIVRLVEGAVARAVHAHLDDATPGGLDDGVGRRL